MIMEYKGIMPEISSEVFVAPSADIIGDVKIAADASVWFGAVIRGDEAPIRIGEGTNIQDNCVLHEAVTLGAGCSVGHGAILHGCTVGDRCLIGMGAIVLNGAKLGTECMVGAGALVTGKTDAPDGSLLLGSPAKVVRPLTEEERQNLLEDAKVYVEKAKMGLPALEW